MRVAVRKRGELWVNIFQPVNIISLIFF
jgi:hypothetical protein